MVALVCRNNKSTRYAAPLQSLKHQFQLYLKFRRVHTQTQLHRVLFALLDGVEEIHRAGFIHRDIKPENIYVRGDGVPLLLDFGSARQSIGDKTKTLTALVSPGYAPYEQYTGAEEGDKQGPWTDIYALGATMYRAVTGRGPIDAAKRAHALLEIRSDPLIPAVELQVPDFDSNFLCAIDHALRFRSGDRPTERCAVAFGLRDPRDRYRNPG